MRFEFMKKQIKRSESNSERVSDIGIDEDYDNYNDFLAQFGEDDYSALQDRGVF